MDQGGKQYKIIRKDLLYPKLSFLINGVLIDVAKTLGGGHREDYYCKAIETGFNLKNIKFEREVYTPLKYKEQIVGKYFLDFLIENKIILEIKRGKFVSVSVIEQTYQYLSAMKLKLALIACFTYNGVVIKRVINEY